MIYGIIKITLYYTDDEIEKIVKIYLKDGDFKTQIEEFIKGVTILYKYTSIDFLYLLVESVSIEYQKKEIFDITKLDI